MRINRHSLHSSVATAAIVDSMLVPVSAMKAGFAVNEQLFQPAKHGSLEQVKSLRLQGTDVNARNNNGQSVLDSSCGFRDQLKAVEYVKSR